MCLTYVYQEAEIEANPLDRAHQDKITLLKQEMSVITETLQKQREIFATIMVSSRTRNHGKLASYERNYDHTRSTREPQHLYSKSRVDPGYNAQYEYDAGHNASPHMAEDPIYVEDPTRNPRSQLSPTDPGGYRDLLVQDCFDLIHKRMRDFDEMNGKATDLETWVSPLHLFFLYSLVLMHFHMARTSKRSTPTETVKNRPSTHSPS